METLSWILYVDVTAANEANLHQPPFLAFSLSSAQPLRYTYVWQFWRFISFQFMTNTTFCIISGGEIFPPTNRPVCLIISDLHWAGAAWSHPGMTVIKSFPQNNRWLFTVNQPSSSSARLYVPLKTVFLFQNTQDRLILNIPQNNMQRNDRVLV